MQVSISSFKKWPMGAGERAIDRDDTRREAMIPLVDASRLYHQEFLDNYQGQQISSCLLLN